MQRFLLTMPLRRRLPKKNKIMGGARIAPLMLPV
jgi:hypothetical protein